jgi:hypothetical protein
LLAFRFASISGVDTANAAHFPSAETCGADARCSFIKSSNVIGCFAACALSETLNASVTTTANPTFTKFIALSFIISGHYLNLSSSKCLVALPAKE